MERKSTRIGYFLLLPSVVLIAVMIVYPAVNTIYQSFFEIRTQTAALGARCHWDAAAEATWETFIPVLPMPSQEKAA